MMSNDESCPECGASWSDVQMNPEDGTIDCPACDHTYEPHDMFQNLVEWSDLPGEIDKAEISPEDLEAVDVTRDRDELTLDVSWAGFGGFVFGLVGTGLLVVGGFIVNRAMTMRALGGDWVGGFAFGSVFLLVGIVGAYRAAAAALNSTVVRVRGDELSVEHGPLPWWGGQTLDASRAEQIFCTSHTKTKDDQSVVTFRVNARMADGATAELLEVPEAADALGIEKALESWLDIEDEAVSEEFLYRD